MKEKEVPHSRWSGEATLLVLLSAQRLAEASRAGSGWVKGRNGDRNKQGDGVFSPQGLV